MMFLSLISVFIRNHLDSEYFYYTCYGLILTFGIIHGANDILILLKDSKKSLSKVMTSTIKYMSVVLLISIFFFSFSTVSLLFFILFSAYHFGEQQWTIFGSNKSPTISLFYFSFGLLIFCILFSFNANEVSRVIFEITNFSVNEEFYQKTLVYISIINLFLLALNFKLLRKQIFHQIALFTVMLIVFFSYDLLPAFAVYFVFFHSIPSILEQSEYLFEKSSAIQSFKLFVMKGLLYWIFAILFLFSLYFFLSKNIDFSLSILFSFLAAITFPHVLVIYKMKNKIHNK
tara:strand:+ start:1052 stop:1915 length:864 start_codon:yes stop_codon:yes gene_type:complete